MAVLKTVTTVAFVLSLICCSRPDIDSHSAQVPSKPLTHASRRILIDGWSHQQVERHYGRPKERKRSEFVEPKYGVSQLLPAFNEQWIYERNMGHILVFFSQGKVALVIEEWSDF